MSKTHFGRSPFVHYQPIIDEKDIEKANASRKHSRKPSNQP